MRPFVNKHNLENMLKLRTRGYTYKSLGIIYNVDFTSIYHHSKNHNIHPVVTRTFEISQFLPVMQVDIYNLIPHRNKSYAEYLRG